METEIGKLLDVHGLALLSAKAAACPLQDPFRIRARYLGWKCAALVAEGQLGKLLALFAKGAFPVGCGWEGDAKIFAHIRECLLRLSADGEIEAALNRCGLPLVSKAAQELVLDTLWPDEIEALRPEHVRRAVLTAWLTPLRQGIGSCFATAPAMLVQQTDPLRMIRDLEQILAAGELGRGLFKAPMSPTGGSGDLAKPIGNLPAASSVGIRLGLHKAGVAFDESVELGPETTAQQIFSETILHALNLTQEDLSREEAFPSAHAAILWEKSGGRFQGLSARGQSILEWKKKLALAKRAFLSLSDCALLRSWEYTVASFSDAKTEFARWNLYVALGIDPEIKPSGLGAFLLKTVQAKLDASNRKLARLQQEHVQAVGQARAAQALLQQATQEGRRSQLKAELSAAVGSVDAIARMMEEEAQAGKWLSTSFSTLMNLAIQELPNSFQEVYDPALSETGHAQFEDSPAGFRLLAKQGRTASASWERIETEKEFVQVVYRFFELLERDLPVDSLSKDTAEGILTALLQHIRSDEFLRGALERTRAHKKKRNATPWAYESGGTMHTLLASYLGPASPISRKIRTPAELYAFLASLADKQPPEPLPIASPTHAFLFYPSWMGMKKDPERIARFFQQIDLSYDMADALCERCSRMVEEVKRPLFFHLFRKNTNGEGLPHVRKGLIEAARLVGLKEEAVDSLLYESLPLLPAGQADKEGERLVKQLDISIRLPPFRGLFVTPAELFDAVRRRLAPPGTPLIAPTDLEWTLAEEARRLQLAYPQPLLFADTNWSDLCFGFVQNFGTGELELWKLNRTGLKGSPMREWDGVFLEGGEWSVFV